MTSGTLHDKRVAHLSLSVSVCICVHLLTSVILSIDELSASLCCSLAWAFLLPDVHACIAEAHLAVSAPLGMGALMPGICTRNSICPALGSVSASLTSAPAPERA